MGAAVTELARAKVNLTLKVVGRRPDGYHLLDSVVVFADVADRLTFEAAIASDDVERRAVASEEQSLRVAESPDDKIIHLDPQAALEAARQSRRR